MHKYHPKADPFCCAGPCSSCGKLTEWKAETMKKAHEKADACGEQCNECIIKGVESPSEGKVI